MTYNAINTNYIPTSLQAGTNPQTSTANAALFQSILQSQSLALRDFANTTFQANSTFGIGSVGTKNVLALPPQMSAIHPASTSANIPENWCISDYYKLPKDEIIPACLELRQEIADTDFSGMSDVEIYDWIENRFKETFGDDFMMASASIQVTLSDDNALSDVEIQTIADMVKASIPGIEYKDIAITDNDMNAYAVGNGN